MTSRSLLFEITYTRSRTREMRENPSRKSNTKTRKQKPRDIYGLGHNGVVISVSSCLTWNQFQHSDQIMSLILKFVINCIRFVLLTLYQCETFLRDVINLLQTLKHILRQWGVLLLCFEFSKSSILLKCCNSFSNRCRTSNIK